MNRYYPGQEWMWLAAAIVVDVAATLGLQAGNGFGWDLGSAAVAAGYVLAFYLLARSLARGMKLGVAYATWGGLGLAAVAGLSVLLFSEELTKAQVGCIVVIVTGVVVLKVGESDGGSA